MLLNRGNLYYGWIVTFACAFIVFGASGSHFSFGVFLKPMTEEFGWSRAVLATAFGTTFMLSGLLRPLGGYLADRYSPKAVALVGIAIVGAMLLLLPYIQTLVHLFTIFAVMSIGLTLAAGPTLTKIVSSWFFQRRGLTLGLINGGGAIGGMVLVPVSSVFVEWFSWQHAYQFLGILLLLVIFPIGLLFIKNRPEDVGLKPEGAPPSIVSADGQGSSPALAFRDSTFVEAFKTPFFWKLTFGYFV